MRKSVLRFVACAFMCFAVVAIINSPGNRLNAKNSEGFEYPVNAVFGVDMLAHQAIQASPDATIHLCYVSQSDFLSVSKFSARAWVIGDKDCVLGAGTCVSINSMERIVFKPISEFK